MIFIYEATCVRFKARNGLNKTNPLKSKVTSQMSSFFLYLLREAILMVTNVTIRIS